MTDTEILRDLAEFLDEATKLTPNQPSRTAAAIRRTLARVAELEAQVAARDKAIRAVLFDHQKQPDFPWCRMCGPQGGRFPCATYAVLTDAKNKEQS